MPSIVHLRAADGVFWLVTAQAPAAIQVWSAPRRGLPTPPASEKKIAADDPADRDFRLGCPRRQTAEVLLLQVA